MADRKWILFVTRRELLQAMIDMAEELGFSYVGKFEATWPNYSGEVVNLSDFDRFCEYREIYIRRDSDALPDPYPEKGMRAESFDWMRIDPPRCLADGGSLTLTEISIDTGREIYPDGHHPDREAFFRQVKRAFRKRAHLPVMWVYTDSKKLKKSNFYCSDEARRFVAWGGELMARAGSMSIAHPYSVLTPDPPDYPFVERPAGKLASRNRNGDGADRGRK